MEELLFTKIPVVATLTAVFFLLTAAQTLHALFLAARISTTRRCWPAATPSPDPSSPSTLSLTNSMRMGLLAANAAAAKS